jgi:small nuclear ribonucleoprotein (snRNP)-like protein
MNMILRDVDEVYSPRPCDRNCRSNVETELDRRRKLSGESEPETNTGGWSVRQRKMKQTMIRGDIVVAVYKACEERPLSKSNYRRSKAKMATIKTKGAPKQTDS